MAIALNDVNVRGDNVIKRLHEKSVPVKSFIVIADKGEMSHKTIDNDSCMLDVCFRKYSMPFYLCQNESLQFGGKYMQCILVCFLKSL